MKVKKFLATACAAVMSLGMGMSIVSAGAEDAGAYVGPNFFNDFQNYTTVEEDGYDPKQLADDWGNGWFDGVGDGTLDAACDPGEDNRNWAIKTDPKDPTNKALYINCIPMQGSFVYFSPKDENSKLISAKNFELSFDFLLVQGLAANGWLGFTIHKTADTRYNGCNNIMLTTRFWNENSISSMIMRNLGMSGINVDPLTEDRASTALNYSCPTNETITSRWYTFKIVANGTQFDAYVDDIHIGGAEITKNPAKKFGFMSIVTCMTEVYIDNVRLVNNDTEAPPVEEEPVTPPAPVVEAPTLIGESVFNLDKGATSALEIGVDVKGQTVTKLEMDGTTVDAKFYTFADNKLTLTAPYVTGLANKVGERTFTITTAGGSVSFTLNVKAEEQTSTQKKEGCKSSIAGGSICAILMGFAALAISKKYR